MPAPPTVVDLRSRLNGLIIADRHKLGRRLANVSELPTRVRPDALRAVATDIDEAEHRLAARRGSVPSSIVYPDDLPITAHRSDLLATIRDNQVVIVAGETGSGKSTQLPKMCLDLGRGVVGLVGHTQPRRIAARAIAERVAEELHTTVGGAVGYKVRFTDEVGDRTLIKVMTDGILLNELQRDRALRGYDTIIIDEAHERSLNIDFLLGYVHQLLPKRPDLKLIITSATIDTGRFSDHFEGAPVVEVSGRAYPVEIRYRPLVALDGSEAKDQTDGIVDAVTELSTEGRGDVLVFCSGEREIRDAAVALRELELPHTEVLPLFGRLSAAEQHRVFSGHGGRRIVVATNVAETSLTVPGIRYVVDAGTARISRFSRRTKVQRLPIEAISQASANQRAGRCGRLGPGICIRLYSAEDFMGRPEFTDPEILRTNLASVILQMAAADLGDIESFPFLEPPDTRTVRDGIALLAELGAVRGDRVGSRNWLNDIGTKLARIPLDPRLGRMVLAGQDENCLREVLIITAALSIIDPRERPMGKEEHAAQMHRRFADERSDFVSLLNLWRYIDAQRRERTSNQFRKMCKEEFLNWRRVREWQDIHAQLRRVVDTMGMKPNREPATPESVHRALLTGLLSQVGRKEPDSHQYRGARGVRFAINPGSVLFKRTPDWVMAAELVETTRLWARVLAAVDPEVVEELASHLVSRTLSDPWWDRERGAVVAREAVTIYGMPLVADRTVLYHRFDPSAARAEFIRHALVLGEWDNRPEFVEHNLAKIEEVAAMEARGRRVDLLVDEEALVRFYEVRIPDDVITVRHFERWWRLAKADDSALLDMSLDDLIAEGTSEIDDELWPPVWRYGDLELGLSYEFDPASPGDGVTIEIPLAALDRIDPGILEWNVPGFRLDLVTALTKSLPKRLRKLFAPVPDTAQEIAHSVGPDDGPIIETLRRELARRSGVGILPDDFDQEAVPRHLRPRFRIVDGVGNLVGTGDELTALRDTMRREVTSAVAELSHPLERDNITDWDFGDLPPTLMMQGTGHEVVAYPALIDNGDSVSIRLLATRQEQTEASWRGQRRLLLLQLPSLRRLVSSLLTGELQLTLAAGPYNGVEEWMQDCVACATDKVMTVNGGLVRARPQFDAMLLAVRNDLADTLETVAAQSTRVLRRLSELRGLLDSSTAESAAAVVEDIEDQIGQFIYPGFLAGVGADRIDDLERYLAAAVYRLEKLPDRRLRDHELMERIRGLEDEHDAIMETLPWDPRMVDVAWMLQELRVSFFAQSIGAKGASEKRVRRALDELVAPD